MIALGVGDIGRNRDAAGRHDREIGNQPFWAILRYQHHPVAVLQPQSAQCLCQGTDLANRLGPAQRLPLAAALGPQERRVAAQVRALEQQFDQIPAGRKIRNINHVHRPFFAAQSCPDGF